MSIQRPEIEHITARLGPVVRIVVAKTQGSAPRDAGAAMLVWAGGQSGTIGGGSLEFQAVQAARAQLADNVRARLQRIPLGPELGQCCGGAVTLVSEIWDVTRLAEAEGPLYVRPLPGSDGADMPLAVRRLLARARAEGQTASACILQGWLVEPVESARRDIWIWGAGHVGRAIVATLLPLPDLRLTWLDTDAARFPDCPEGVVQKMAANPADFAGSAPETAEHLVLTFSHALDLEICHRLLGRGFGALGLIGSATKWARFRTRLLALGHRPDAIGRIRCPIGDPALGKHPQAIAIGVAADLLRRNGAEDAGKDSAGADAARGERDEWTGRIC